MRRRKKTEEHDEFIIYEDFLLKWVKGKSKGAVKGRFCFSRKWPSEDQSAAPSHRINAINWLRAGEGPHVWKPPGNCRGHWTWSFCMWSRQEQSQSARKMHYPHFADKELESWRWHNNCVPDHMGGRGGLMIWDPRPSDAKTDEKTRFIWYVAPRFSLDYFIYQLSIMQVSFFPSFFHSTCIKHRRCLYQLLRYKKYSFSWHEICRLIEKSTWNHVRGTKR